MADRSVVITGAGAASPLGVGFDALREGLLAGRDGVRPVSLFDASGLDVAGAAEVIDYDDAMLPSDPRWRRVLSRPMRLALVAAGECVRSAGLGDRPDVLAKTACLYAIGRHDYAVDEFRDAIKRSRDDEGKFDLARFYARGARAIYPLALLAFIPNLGAAHVGTTFGVTGEANTYTAEGASAIQAIADAAASIRDGLFDVALCGGCDARVDPFAVARLLALNLLAPAGASSAPFDVDRRGYVLGEGAAFFVVEAEDHAERRGARPLARVLGWGGGSDAYHPYRAHPEGRGLARAMRGAVERAGGPPVDCVVAAASSTPDYDAAEALAIRATFGTGGGAPAVTAPASMLGRAHAASGAFAVATALVALGAQAVPPTINTRALDPQSAPANVATGAEAVGARVRAVCANGYAIGGQAASIVLGEVAR